ncbi:hypothetical protein BS47DRAFT_1484718 [Hydnum rufescens UP504]|uniref:Mitochondrial inner membrane protease ATP23 n=1 Tax=Hydnum rufescens UP504 TaxID=1448309 RepID=A0A9P6AZP1_9AGAM|nr:hypothetical protein BS47DRAFT_1484718 [Hydnum rufescens UP504]
MAITGSDPSSGSSSKDERAFDQWRRTAAAITGLGLTPEEAKIRQQNRNEKILNAQRQQCLLWRNDLLRQSPAVTFMTQHIGQQGISVDASNIVCRPCNKERSGGFSPGLQEVLLCQDGFHSKKHMEDTLVHELIHLYDHAKFKVDWNDLRHVACSEIRAANLSGDCKWDRELMRRGILGFTKHHQVCVRRRATLSVAQHPACKSEEDAKRAVNEAWESCIGDTRPFDEIY